MKESVINFQHELIEETRISEKDVDTRVVKDASEIVVEKLQAGTDTQETIEITINKKNISKIIERGIVYIRPFYIDNRGILTEILTVKERYITQSRVEYIIDLILYEFMLNRIALKDKTSRILNQRNVVPYCVNSDLLLVPFKMIDPIGKESCVGYINYRYISGTGDIKKCHCNKSRDRDKIDKRMNPNKNKSRNQSVVLLGNLGQVKVLASRKTCLKHFRECFLAAVQIHKRVDIELICE